MTHYPSLVWMKNGKIVNYYHGDHSLESLKTYVFSMMKPKILPAVNYEGSSEVDFVQDDDYKRKVSNERLLDKAFEASEGDHHRIEVKASSEFVANMQTPSASASKDSRVDKSEDVVAKGPFPVQAESERSPARSTEKYESRRKSSEKHVKEDATNEDSSYSESAEKQQVKRPQQGHKILLNGIPIQMGDAEQDKINSEPASDNYREKADDNISTDDNDNDNKSTDDDDSDDDEGYDESQNKSKLSKKSTPETAVIVAPIKKVVKSSNSTLELLELTASNFSQSLNPTGVTFIMMYAKWCRKCDDIRKVLKAISVNFSKSSTIRIGQINCVKEENEDFCMAQKMQDIPTMNVYRDGKLILNNFKGTTEKEIQDCIVSHLTNEGETDFFFNLYEKLLICKSCLEST